jgi:hypothetical protein
MESVVQELLQRNGIFIVTAIVIFLFKDAFARWWDSFVFFWRSEYKEDDVISLNGKPARIIRTGIFKTVFFVYNIRDGRVHGGSKMVVHNDKLKDYHIEKPLPPLDLSPWLGDKKSE